MDVEKIAGLDQYLTGYASFAAFIATDRDQTSAIFKRFKRLGARHLLHLQSRLAELQSKLDDLDREELNGGMELKQCSRNWKTFCDVATHNQRQQRKMALVDEVGSCLKNYR
jgi:hypothetical protein